MNMPPRSLSIVTRQRVLLVVLSLALPLPVSAQTAPAVRGCTAPKESGVMDVDHALMHHAGAPVHPRPSTRPVKARQVEKRGQPRAAIKLLPASTGGTEHGAAHGMGHGAPASADVSGIDDQATLGMQHDTPPDSRALPDMPMGPMQGGNAPAHARSSDYSDGIAASVAHPLHLHGSVPSSMVLINQLEAFHGRDANGQSWDVQAWYGNDSDKVWLRSEGGRSSGKLEDGNVEVFWNHNVAKFWSTQTGARHDFGAGPARDWAAFGVQGLAPYWLELEATGYVGGAGRTAARLRVDYELLFTQRLVLQPEAEVNLYGRNDPQRRVGRGVSDVQFGLRLRYEIRRQFAPYIGVNWVRRVRTSADYARQDRLPVSDRQWLAGIRIWF